MFNSMKSLLEWIDNHKITDNTAALMVCSVLAHRGDPTEFEVVPTNIKQLVDELRKEYHTTGKIISIGGGGGRDHTADVAKVVSILQR